jgi:hypothetical protein
MNTVCTVLALATAMAGAPGKPMKPPLHVNGDEKMLYVHAQGIPVGELLARMGASAGWTVRVQGDEANIPVWVYADGEEPRTLIRRVALSAGLDGADREPKERGLWLLGTPPTDTALVRPHAPWPTAVYPSGAPEELALLLRTHVLSSQGSAVPVPARGALIVEDEQPGSTAARRLVGLLTPNANLGPMVVEPLPATSTLMERCAAQELKAWKVLDAQAGVANGEPIGQLLVTLAGVQNRQVVVGCGGHAPAFTRYRKDSSMEELALENGLRVMESAGTGTAARGVVFAAGGQPAPRPTDGTPRRALLLFPVRKPEQYTPALTEWLHLKVTALPALGWIAVEFEASGARGQADPLALQVDRTLRDLMPRPPQPLPPLRVVALDIDHSGSAVP